MIGPFAAPDVVHIASGLPKDAQREDHAADLRKIAASEYEGLGDLTTLAEPEVVEKLIESTARPIVAPVTPQLRSGRSERVRWLRFVSGRPSTAGPSAGAFQRRPWPTPLQRESDLGARLGRCAEARPRSSRAPRGTCVGTC